MVKVKNNFRMFATQFLSVLNSTLSHVTQQRSVGILTGTLRYLNSAKKIGDIVEELIKNSNKSVETMNGVLDEINEQNEKLSTTREAFDGLNTEVGNVVVAIDNIRREIETVNTAKNDVMSSMESLAAIAQENAASTEETSASMTELSGIVTDCNAQTKNLVDIAEKLSDNVNQFRIKE